MSSFTKVSSIGNSDGPFVGVAVGKVDSDQFHSGIIIRDLDDGSLKFIHLAWHYRLQKDNLEGDLADYYLSLPQITDEDKRSLSVWCIYIYNQNKDGLPYGLLYDNGSFDPNGIPVLGNGVGFTCATFILAVFKTAEINLIDLSTWQSRDSDAIWQKTIIGKLIECKAPKEHIEALENEVGCFRYRPDEVASAGCHYELPANFSCIQPYVMELHSLL